MDEERSLLLLQLLLLAVREGEWGGDFACGGICLWLVGSQEGSHAEMGDGCCSRAVKVTGANTAAGGRGEQKHVSRERYNEGRDQRDGMREPLGASVWSALWGTSCTVQYM